MKTSTRFADTETASMLEQMNFLYPLTGSWMEIEEWLFKNGIFVNIEMYRTSDYRYHILDSSGKDVGLEIIVEQYKSPITARIYGIKGAVKYKWEQFKKQKI